LTGEALAAVSILEDELAQLVSDGIFISVAAGNSFTTYGSTGLAYPASSPSVVAVSSVDGDGSMSYFSQRDEGVIAAPGRSILSSVPDYFGDGNGLDDDYARYSGTSMAAPYVAAASVLLREAYQAVGVQDVTQQMLYQTMVNTADSVYDAATGLSYYRLNLGRAIESVMALSVTQETTEETGAAAAEETTSTQQTQVAQTEATQQSDPVQTDLDTGTAEQADTGGTSIVENPSTGGDESEDPGATPVDAIVTQDPADTPVSEPLVQDPADTSVSEPIVQAPADTSVTDPVVHDSTDTSGGAIVTQDPADTPADQVATQNPGDASNDQGSLCDSSTASDSGANAGLPIDGSTGHTAAAERIEHDQASAAASRVPFWFSHSDVRPGTVWLVSKDSITLFPTAQGRETSSSLYGAQYDLGLGELWSSGRTSAGPVPGQGAIDTRATDWLYSMDRSGVEWQEVDGLDEVAAGSSPQPTLHTAEYSSADAVWTAEGDLWQAA